ncbi:SDR family oxidoreductase [Corynebacterium sp. UMB9976]|uniref:SDR family oxidoreductase n=1 Tax=Corynebacterium sp. UMB9976 TaxID=3046354 RepID=UPI00254FDA43|nr:SDR family oxidoreductase [Corynebacterium sp. UMB9976]MDK6302326.1 SDR family oxidoreductase [Corynebacterium sp. UMB9976]
MVSMDNAALNQDHSTSGNSGNRPLALITGASRGIGRAIAEDLARDHRLILCCSSETSAHSLREDFPDAQVVAVDLSDPAALAEAFSSDVAPQRLDLLVHSAGVTGHAPIAEAPLQMWREVLDVNVIAVAELTRLLLPALREARGMVIAINSGAGHNSGPGYGPYAASKFALKAITDALREEERGRVRVSSVHPGKVDSDMQRELQAQAGNDSYDPGVYVRAEDIAAAVRLAAEMGPAACLETVSVRPVVK